LIRHQRFTIKGPSSPCIYLAPLWRYGASTRKERRKNGKRKRKREVKGRGKSKKEKGEGERK